MRIDDFGGCKLALFQGNRVLIYMRDEKEGIPFPGMLDLPGGGREGNETPEECVLRELQEEFGLSLSKTRLCYRERYTTVPHGTVGHFFTTEISESEVKQISFGNEGLYWKMMPTEEYLAHPKGIPHFKSMLSTYLGGESAS